jgi:hypothetical protein
MTPIIKPPLTSLPAGYMSSMLASRLNLSAVSPFPAVTYVPACHGMGTNQGYTTAYARE